MDLDGRGVLIGDPEGDHLRLRAGDPTSGPDPGDAFVPCSVEVRAGVFRARAASGVLTSELARFRDDLARLPADPRGRAALETEDGWLAIRLFGDGFGHCDARCELRDPDVAMHRLEFTVGLDVRDLAPLLAGLEAVLRRATAGAA